jgi:DNA repair protein RadC
MNTLREHLHTYGATALSTLDLLALTLAPQTDANLLARLAHLLQSYDVRRLRQTSIQEFQQVGLSKTQAERLVAICELTQRLAVLEMAPLPKITVPHDAVQLLRPLMSHLDHEVMRVLVLNTKNQVVENTELYRGTVNTTVVRIAEILRLAILRKCTGLLIAHLHPSGDPTPSPEDRELTGDLVRAARLCEIEVVDHLIIGNPGYISLKNEMRW